ncbi:MAG: type II CRISPR-associated endonuclease Cas1 [Lacipirellulaceae bacterium]
MNNRILDLSQSPAKLFVRDANLVVEAKDQTPARLPLVDVAVLVVSHPQVHYTHAVLAGIASAGGVFITCDGKHLPIGMLLPLAAHFAQVERFAAQASAKLPVRKRVWRQIVRAKITAQSNLLSELRGNDAGLGQLVSQVRSGDPANVEARAARRYWQQLFADPRLTGADSKGFRRDQSLDDGNALLNYGYTVLRAIVARAICAAGLHPSLGVHHHNKYATYPLADDLMEPVRPLVDREVVGLLVDEGPQCELTPAVKQRLIKSLLVRAKLEGEQRTVFDAMARTASSLAEVFLGEREKIVLPEV